MRLSSNDRRLADHLLMQYPSSAWETVEEVAQQAGVSKSAVVRFASRLGYSGFAELQQELRGELSRRLASPLLLLRDRPNSADDHLIDRMLQLATQSLTSTAADLRAGRLDEAVRMITGCRGRILVFGMRKSHGIAQYLYNLLGGIVPNVQLLHIHDASFPEVLLNVSADDLVLAITIRRYSPATLESLSYCREQGASVITITDTHAGPASAQSMMVLVGASDGISFFDSILSVIFIVEALVNAIVADQRGAVASRLERVEELRERFGTYRGTERRERPKDTIGRNVPAQSDGPDAGAVAGALVSHPPDPGAGASRPSRPPRRGER